MSGIAGWIAEGRGAAPREEALLPMLEALAHRGRPGEALVALVERRGTRRAVMGAAICDRESGVAVALDGAIANARELREELTRKGYAFPRASGAEADAEIVLRAYQRWDRDAPKHLHGAFAIALWDSRRQRLLLARDRFGEKPLHVCERGGSLYFASEPKALLALPGIPAEIDHQAMRDYLERRYVGGERTLFAGIRRLAPATFALWEFGRLRETRYWFPPDRDARRASHEENEDAVGGFAVRLRDALGESSDSGILLSGGLDSAALLSLAADGKRKVKTWSLGFEGDRKSELPQAAAVAQHFGAEHHEVVVKPSDLAPSLERMVAALDAPLGRASDLAVHRLASEASRSVRIVLTGDGCDEVLGGYRRHVMESFQPGFCRSLEERGARWVDVVMPAGEQAARPEEEPDQAADPNSSVLRRVLYCGQTGELPGQLLERNDRACASARVEARMPFLDHRLAEYVSALPDGYRVRGLSTKWILRAAAKRLVPERLARRKGGFRVPLRDWLRNDLRDTLLEHLQGAASFTRRYYDSRALDRMLAEHLRGRNNHEIALWTLLNLEIWHRKYRPTA
jgi:asparagine synthase (glutamine-hydrolysing)